MSHFIYCYAECHYAECHYAKCHYAECHYAERRYAEYRGAIIDHSNPPSKRSSQLIFIPSHKNTRNMQPIQVAIKLSRFSAAPLDY
jgi:hypothetical protein